MLKTLICVLGSLLLLAPAAPGGEEPTRLRLRLEVGQRYRFALTEDHRLTVAGKTDPGPESTVEYTLEVLARSPEGDYEVAMSYRVVGSEPVSERPLSGSPVQKVYRRLEEEGWRMTVTDRGVIREVTGPPGLFRDLREKAAASRSLQERLRHVERGIGDEGLRFMMQDDLALRLPDEISPGDRWETRSRLPTPHFDDVRALSRHRFTGIDRGRARPCARIVTETDVEVVEAGEDVGGRVLGREAADATWRSLPPEASMERCVDLETGLPVEVLTLRHFGVEVAAPEGAESAAADRRLTVRERDHLRGIGAVPGDAWVYWGRDGEIGRMRTDGSQVEVLLRGNAAPAGIAVDETTGEVFWTDPDQGAVYRAGLDGSGVVPLHQGHGRPGILALDGDALVWVDTGARVVRRLERSAAGSGAPRELTAMSSFNPVSVAIHGGEVYFTTTSSKRLQRVARGGDRREDEVLWLTDEMASIAVDGEQVCWLDNEDPAVWCSALDGGGRTRVVDQGAGRLSGLNLQGGQLTWVASPGAGQGPSTFRRADVGGGEVADLVTTPGWVRGLAVTGDSLFWTEGRELRRYDLEDRRPRTLAVGGTVGRVQRLASHDGKLYWIEDAQGGGKLRRSELDGSQVEDLVSGIRSPTGLAVVDSRLLWTEDRNDCSLMGADLDGTGARQISACGRGRPDRLITARGKIYWADSVLGYILYAAADGSQQGPVVALRSRYLELMAKTMSGEVESSASPDTVVVHQGRVYWTDSSNEKIVRAELDGGGRHDLIAGLGHPGDLAIDDGRIYWTDIQPHRIRRARLDGSAVEDVVVARDGHPDEIAVAGGKLYWSGTTGDLEPFISRADLDGSGVEVLLAGDEVTGPGFQLSARRKELIVAFPDDLVVAGGKLYWPEHASGRILRADLDGSGVEVLIEGVRQVEGLTVAGGWLYWAGSRDSVFRSRLDGTGAQELGELEGSPQSLAVADGRFYWADLEDDRVLSAALDGSDVRDLFTGPSFPPPGYGTDELRPQMISGLARLVSSILWTDYTGGTIQRSGIASSVAGELASKLLLPRALRVHDADLYWADVHGIQRARFAAPASPRLLLGRKDVEDLLIVVESGPAGN